MKTIKIVSTMNFSIKRQIPSNNDFLSNFKFIFDDSIDCDYCFLIDEVKKDIKVNCPKKNLILCLGEPKHVKIYPNSYIKQFGRVASFYKLKDIDNIPINYPLLPWMVGISFDSIKKEWIKDKFLSYDDFLKNDFENRLDKIAIITSNKSFTKSHKKRLDFVLQLKEILGEYLDIYGNGFIPVQDKYEVLKNYKYCLAIENCRTENYWTEKLADSILSGCYTFYNGCTNFDSFFNNPSIEYIDINKVSITANKILNAIKGDIYKDNLDNIVQIKEKILNKYNIIFSIAEFVSNDIDNKKEYKSEVFNILPINQSFINKVKTKIYRLIY